MKFIHFAEMTFQATHEVDHFAIDLAMDLTSPLYLLLPDGLTPQQRTCFQQLVQDEIGPFHPLDTSALAETINAPQAASLLFANLVAEDRCSSICSHSICNHSSDHHKITEYASFWAAYEQDKKTPNQRWDPYTQLKIERFNRELNHDPLPTSLQGINIDTAVLKSLDKMAQTPQAQRNKTNPSDQSTKSIRIQLRRIKTELWLKEALLQTKCITPFKQATGRYTAFYLKKTHNAELYVSHVTLALDGEHIHIVATGITQGDEISIQLEHPELAGVAKFFDRAFYLFDHQHDALLTSYTSGRIPSVIGPTQFDVVDRYHSQKEQQSLTEHKGEKFNAYSITRSAKTEKNVLPYYLNRGRSSQDPLSKNHMKCHRIYLMPHAEGVYFLVSPAQPAQAKIAKQNRIENLVIWDRQGKPLDVFNHPLTSLYLNSFTLDILKQGESSKSSLFVKLARLLLEN